MEELSFCRLYGEGERRQRFVGHFVREAADESTAGFTLTEHQPNALKDISI